MKSRGDRTMEGRMSDRRQSEGLWAILFERLRQREVDGSRAMTYGRSKTIAPSMMEESWLVAGCRSGFG